MRKFVCIVVVILLNLVHQSKADISAITCTVGDNANGNKKCQDQDPNTECLGTAKSASKCTCKADYFLSSDKTQCLQKITTVDCAGGAAGTTKCKQIDANSECPANGGKCKCKKEYTGTDSCTKVLGGTCPASDDCSGSVDNSECTDHKCECGANFIEENAVCKKALGQTCIKKDDCVSNAECDQTCKCSAGFTDTKGLCAVECKPAHATDGDTKCQQVDANLECKTGGTTCTCKKGYSGVASCTKVLGETCRTDVDCTGLVANSVCSPQKVCKCKNTYTEESAVCKTADSTKPFATDTTCDPDHRGDAKCLGVDPNSECPASTTKCACKADFFLSSDKTCALKITTVGCTPDDNTEGTTKCQTVDENSECPAERDKCACKSGYSGTDSCTKVATDTTCDPNHGGDAKCHGVDLNSECPASTSKCACKADYFLSSDKICVLKITTVACTADDNTEGTTKCQKVDENSECPAEGEKCACKAGYSGTYSCTKDAGSSATSAWMTTSLIVTSLLIYLPRLICG